MDTSVCVTNTCTGSTVRLTVACPESSAPRPEACVFSPDGDRIAYVRHVPGSGIAERSRASNQIFVVTLASELD